MQEIEKNIAEIRSSLFSGNIDLVLDTIDYIRNSTAFYNIEMLLDLYVTTSKNEVRRAVLNLLIDVRDQDFVDVYMEAIIKPKYQSIVQVLISVCWQNGLDYSKYFEFFVKTFVYGTLETAIECYTVIEEIICTNPENAMAFKEIALGNTSSDNHKKNLIENLLNTIQ